MLLCGLPRGTMLTKEMTKFHNLKFYYSFNTFWYRYALGLSEEMSEIFSQLWSHVTEASKHQREKIFRQNYYC